MAPQISTARLELTRRPRRLRRTGTGETGIRMVEVSLPELVAEVFSGSRRIAGRDDERSVETATPGRASDGNAEMRGRDARTRTGRLSVI